jgi:hypothetical protein
MYRAENTWIDGPIRARHEPPTIREAIAAAEAMTSDREQQAEFAAGLMGIPVEEVRPYLKPAGSVRRGRLTTIGGASSQAGRQGVVVVERKIRRTMSLR